MRVDREYFMLTRREFTGRVLAGGAGLLAPAPLLAATKSQASSDQGSKLDCDLLIKGGTVIDPGQQLHGLSDVAVKDGRILEVSRDIPEARALRVVSAEDKIIAPGFIDIHVHCFDGMTGGTNADHSCLGRGVTTVVDAGSVGYPMIAAFVKYIINTSATRIFALVDIGALGTMVGIKDVMKNLDWVNPELTAKAAEQYRPAVVGIKVRLQEEIQGGGDVECLKRALEAAEASHLPLMAHIDGSYSPLPDLVKLLRRGDIFTHFMNGHSHGVLDSKGDILPEVREARERGVIFDSCEGTSHLTFDVAEKCIAQNFLPDTISTDLSTMSPFGSVYDLPTEVSKLIALGISLDKAIEMVTTKPARVFDYGVQLGTLKPGTEADIGIFELREGTFEFRDTARQKRTGHQMLVNKAVVRRGQFFSNEN
jgi:dihydroorotase